MMMHHHLTHGVWSLVNLSTLVVKYSSSPSSRRRCCSNRARRTPMRFLCFFCSCECLASVCFEVAANEFIWYSVDKCWTYLQDSSQILCLKTIQLTLHCWWKPRAIKTIQQLCHNTWHENCVFEMLGNAAVLPNLIEDIEILQCQPELLIQFCIYIRVYM